MAETDFSLDTNQRDLLNGVCQFYGFTHLTFFSFTRKSLIKALDFIIADLEFKLCNSQTRYHSVLVTDIEALRSIYSQIV